MATKVVRALGKGLITIPREFREALGIQRETLLSVTLEEGHLKIALYRGGSGAVTDQKQTRGAPGGIDTPRRFGDEDVRVFMEHDVLDEEMVMRIQEILGHETFGGATP